jgi:hypothetical protein
MKKNNLNILIRVFLICCFLISCDENLSEGNTYFKNFFMGDDSFVIEGEVFDGNGTMFRLSVPADIDFITAKVRSNAVEDWEINGTISSGNKYRILISKTANGVNIGKGTIKSSGYNSFKDKLLHDIFPENFPVCELGFYINAYKYGYNPIFEEPGGADQKYPHFYDYYYIYVAEPVDVSQTVTEDYKDPWWGQRSVYKYHYDLNFPKPGWYKIVYNYGSPVNVNDLRFLSGKDTYFSIGD